VLSLPQAAHGGGAGGHRHTPRDSRGADASAASASGGAPSLSSAYEFQRLSTLVWTVTEGLEGDELPNNVEGIAWPGAVLVPATVPPAAAAVDTAAAPTDHAAAAPPLLRRLHTTGEDRRWTSPAAAVARLRILRGLTRERMGHLPLALADYEAAIAADPTAGVALIHRARCCVKMNRYESVAADVAAALPLVADKVGAYTLLGKAQFAVGDDAGAFDAFTNALAAGGCTAGVYMRRAAAAACLGRMDVAHDDLSQVLHADAATRFPPHHRAEAHQQRGFVRYCLGDLAGALADYQAALAALDEADGDGDDGGIAVAGDDEHMAGGEGSTAGPVLRLQMRAAAHYFQGIIQANRDEFPAAVGSLRAALATMATLQAEDDLVAACRAALPALLLAGAALGVPEPAVKVLSPSQLGRAGAVAAAVTVEDDDATRKSILERTAHWVPVVKPSRVRAAVAAAAATGDDSTLSTVVAELFKPCLSPIARGRFTDPMLLSTSAASGSPLATAISASQDKAVIDGAMRRLRGRLRPTHSDRDDVQRQLSTMAGALNRDAALPTVLRRLRPCVHHELAKALQLEGDQREAFVHFTITLAHCPTSATAMLRRGLAAHAMGAIAAAGADLNAAALLRPDDATLRINFHAVPTVQAVVLRSAGDEDTVPIVGVDAAVPVAPKASGEGTTFDRERAHAEADASSAAITSLVAAWRRSSGRPSASVPTTPRASGDAHASSAAAPATGRPATLAAKVRLNLAMPHVG